MCRSNRVRNKLGGLAVLLQCCVCDAILTSSTPSQSFNKHFSCDGFSILSCKRAREGQLTAADVAPAREAAKTFLLCDHQFLGLSQSVIPKAMNLLLMHNISCCREWNWSAWGNLCDKTNNHLASEFSEKLVLIRGSIGCYS
jgi:hypothetical protein